MRNRLSVYGLSLVLAITAFAVVAAGCATSTQPTAASVTESASASPASKALAHRVPKDVPVPEDIVITPPGPDVPAALAGLSGAWVGEWYGGLWHHHMGDQLFVFEKISPTSVTVVSTGIGRFRGMSYSNYGQTWGPWRREHSLGKDVVPLTFTGKNGEIATYKLLADGRLNVQVEYANGSFWVGTFEKIRLQ